MTAPATPPASPPLYPSRSGAGAFLGRTLVPRVMKPTMMLGVTPSGVEIGANAAQAMVIPFDVVVSAHIRMEGLGIIGALAEDADAVLDANFQPRFGMIDALNEAIDKARRAVKTERLLFRGHRPMRAVEGHHVVVMDGHMISPWKALASAKAAADGGAASVTISAAAATQPVQELIRNRRIFFVCPAVVMDPKGHPRPFGDPMDPTAERLRSIVVARQAA